MTEAWREVADTCLGWLHPDEGPTLRKYAETMAVRWRPLPMAEIGGYAGKSACWLGSAAQERQTVLYSIDWHRGSPEMAEGRECHHPEMVGLDGRFDSLPHFRKNIRAAGLEDTVIPVAGRSEVVGSHWQTPLSLLFIDGGHDGESVQRDYDIWHHHVVQGGYLLFHDTPIPEIDEVATRAVTCREFELIEQVDSLRVLQRR